MTPPLLQAYGSSRIAAGQVQQILHWPGSFETFRKIPTCLLYSDDGQVLAWGLEAKNASPMPGTVKCEWSVLVVYPVILSADPYGILRHILTIVAHFGSDVWLTAFPFHLRRRQVQIVLGAARAPRRRCCGSPPALVTCTCHSLEWSHYSLKGEAATDNPSEKSRLLTTSVPLCTARQESHRSDRRLPILHLGVRKTADNPRDWCCC